MEAFRFDVTYADGDDWSAPRQFSQVEVLAADALEARLAAEQMVYTPQPGKAGHVQITSTTIAEK